MHEEGLPQFRSEGTEKLKSGIVTRFTIQMAVSVDTQYCGAQAHLNMFFVTILTLLTRVAACHIRCITYILKCEVYAICTDRKSVV